MDGNPTDPAERLIVGLMSGSSLDGIDAALVAVQGCCDETRLTLRHFTCLEFDAETKASLLDLFSYENATVDKLCLMHAILGEYFADAVAQVTRDAGVEPRHVDLVGVWPQMMYHLPGRSNPFRWRGRDLGACLQIGDLSRIAERTGITTIGSFCSRDLAAGGNGAPLTGLGDYVLYRDPGRTRIVQNIGGIANANLVPGAGGLGGVVGFDTGPGNMVIDGLVRHFTGGELDFDEDGRIAARGTVNGVLLETLMRDPFINLAPPKAAGRENYGEHYVRELIAIGQRERIGADDLVATATALTAESMARSYQRYFEPLHRVDEVIVGGGGARNKTLLTMLADRVGYPVTTDDDHGIPSFAKEAMYMALLANEASAGHANNAPSVTGAGADVVMGLIAPGKGWSRP
jgi:anhydro-N-acetylmuramic acid kinase